MTTLRRRATLRRVRVLGQDVRVAVRPGTATGPPLVLCNGIGASLDLLEPFVAEAAARPRGRVVRRSRRRRIFPARECRTTSRCCPMLLGRLLRELGYDTVDMLGISWGGGLAQQFAFQNPRRCRRLVLVSTGTGSLMVPAHPRVLAKMLTPRRYRDPDFAVSIAATLYGGQLRDQSTIGAATAARPVAARVRAAATSLQLAAGAGWTSLPFLPMLRQQTLVLAGNDDPIIPLVNARMINRLLPHSRLHVFDDGHLGLVTCAAELGPMVGELPSRARLSRLAQSGRSTAAPSHWQACSASSTSRRRAVNGRPSASSALRTRYCTVFLCMCSNCAAEVKLPPVGKERRERLA